MVTKFDSAQQGTHQRVLQTIRETKTKKHNNYINVNSKKNVLNLLINSVVPIVGKRKQQNTTLCLIH